MCDTGKISPTKKSLGSTGLERLLGLIHIDSNFWVQQQQNSDEDPCPILSKQLLLPKKRKISSILDQNKNVEIVADHSDSSEADVVVKSEPPEPSQDDEDEEEESRSVLEPEVGLSIKGEASDSEDSLPNGDILLQRLKRSGN